MTTRALDIPCGIENCARPSYVRGAQLCIRHYRRFRRHGDPLGGGISADSTPTERFWASVNQGSGDDCWLWTGRMGRDGYGQMGIDYKNVYAHRFAYTLLVGPIPDGLVIDHLCRVHNCVNPAHLEAVTDAVNLARGFGVCAQNARKTHCIRGHEYTPENTISGTRDGRPTRRCRTCDQARRAALRTVQR